MAYPRYPLTSTLFHLFKRFSFLDILPTLESALIVENGILQISVQSTTTNDYLVSCKQIHLKTLAELEPVHYVHKKSTLGKKKFHDSSNNN